MRGRERSGGYCEYIDSEIEIDAVVKTGRYCI
jgi:hypothetical protein